MQTAQTLKIITDASVVKQTGKYKGRAGIVVLDENDILHKFDSRHLGNVTSNEGEYEAMLLGVKEVAELLEKQQVNKGEISLELYTDSSLLYNQIMGNYRTKKGAFIKLQNDIKKLCKSFKGTKIIWHKRDLDMAVLADFGSKHPRRTKSIFDKFKSSHFSEAVEKASKFLIKDEEKAEKEKERE